MSQVHEGAKSQTVDAKKLAMYLDAAQKYLGDKPFLLYDVATYADVCCSVLQSVQQVLQCFDGPCFLLDVAV